MYKLGSKSSKNGRRNQIIYAKKPRVCPFKCDAVFVSFSAYELS